MFSNPPPFLPGLQPMHSLIIEWQIGNALLWSFPCRRNFTNRLESVTFFCAQIFQLRFPIKVFTFDKVHLQNGANCRNVFQMVLQTSQKTKKLVFSQFDFTVGKCLLIALFNLHYLALCLYSSNLQCFLLQQWEDA